jgi:hypothetical protein
MSVPINIPSSDAAPLRSGWRDWLGIVASVGCAIHCAAMPFVIAYLPSLGLSFLADESFHKWMFVVCMGIGLAAFLPGWRLHRRLLPVGVAGVGLTFIGVAAFGLAGECCPSCEIDGSGLSAVGNSDAGEASTSSCCEHGCCVHESATDEDTPSTSDAVQVVGKKETESTDKESTAHVVQASVLDTSLLAPFAPWVTPIGGVLLVFAHLMNRRYGCRCGCCEVSKPTAPGDSSDVS